MLSALGGNGRVEATPPDAAAASALDPPSLRDSFDLAGASTASEAVRLGRLGGGREGGDGNRRGALPSAHGVDVAEDAWGDVGVVEPESDRMSVPDDEASCAADPRPGGIGMSPQCKVDLRSKLQL